MEGRFLEAPTADALRAAATQAAGDGVEVVFLTTGPLGDAITLAASLSSSVPTTLLGIRTNLHTEPHRHPTVLARDMTALDLLSRGRTLLAFTPPFGPAEAEAIALCRGMWREGIAASDGPQYPVAGAVNRPRPFQAAGPLIALDLTDGLAVEPGLLALADLVLVADAAPLPPGLPPGVEVCRIGPPT